MKNEKGEVEKVMENEGTGCDRNEVKESDGK